MNGSDMAIPVVASSEMTITLRTVVRLHGKQRLMAIRLQGLLTALGIFADMSLQVPAEVFLVLEGMVALDTLMRSVIFSMGLLVFPEDCQQGTASR